MAYANLNETLMSYKLRRNRLQVEITNMQSQKRMALNEQLDFTQLIQARKAEAKNEWKAEYEANKDGIYADLVSYTEIDEYEDAVDKIQADFEIFNAELTAWETDLDTRIATADVELKEVEAYISSFDEMLSSNIQNDHNYGKN